MREALRLVTGWRAGGLAGGRVAGLAVVGGAASRE